MITKKFILKDKIQKGEISFSPHELPHIDHLPHELPILHYTPHELPFHYQRPPTISQRHQTSRSTCHVRCMCILLDFSPHFALTWLNYAIYNLKKKKKKHKNTTHTHTHT
jgi:hypothetical protein